MVSNLKVLAKCARYKIPQQKESNFELFKTAKSHYFVCKRLTHNRMMRKYGLRNGAGKLSSAMGLHTPRAYVFC